ncbi:MAG: aspartate carbamoyltransferase catalytic subunit [Pelagimonas sp.]|jgi:hypothetical protein|nr:aspartate carbamoyltransferase catalytic subunit [Pelagimonas sp.]
MTQIPINGSETGVVRLFHLDLPAEAIERFTVQAGTGEWPLKYGLGAEKLRAAFVEVVDLRDLAGLSLTGYLRDGYGVDPANLKADQAMINALKGCVVILPSTAFDTHSQTLTIAPPLRFIGAYGEVQATARTPRLRSHSTQGTINAAPAPAHPRIAAWLKLALLGIGVFAILALALVLR